MKKVLILATGGTIASQLGEEGMVPKAAPPELLGALQKFGQYYDIEYRAILNLDSSNIQPEEWKIIARSIFDELPNYDGFVVTHGTDTMAYTASMITFMLQNLDKPVVFTGSQIPISSPLSDAQSNLATAFAAIDHNVIGVTIAFNHKLMRGCRAVKVRTMGFDAFESVNSQNRGEFFADGIRLVTERFPLRGEKCELKSELSDEVFLLKLIPGTNPKIFDCLQELKYRGVVLETFGAGGLHYLHRDLYTPIKRLVDSGIPVVVCSQCLYEKSDFSLYEVGRKVIATGAIQSLDMTTEAAVTKLMWALGQSSDADEIRRMFETNYAGEITF
ncbi:MAG: asparaginase [Clostridia bacterium]|nr:asparaginase [Clostridia bacterium]